MNCRLCGIELKGSGNKRYCCREHYNIDENRYVGESVVEYFARKQQREQIAQKSSYPPLILSKNML